MSPDTLRYREKLNQNNVWPWWPKVHKLLILTTKQGKMVTWPLGSTLLKYLKKSSQAIHSNSYQLLTFGCCASHKSLKIFVQSGFPSLASPFQIIFLSQYWFLSEILFTLCGHKIFHIVFVLWCFIFSVVLSPSSFSS